MGSVIDYIIPPKCFQKFVHENNFEVECIKIVISKLLGFAIILGSAMVKVPQIIKISQARSAEGISFIGVILELIACTGTLAYSFANGFPFSSYGEATFMAFQQAIIMFLVLWYGSGSTQAIACTALYSAVFAYLMSPGVPMQLLVLLQASVVVLVIVSRLIQAFTNYSNQSTGQLSLITILLQSVGAAIRILTSLQETGDTMMIFTYIISTLTNGFLLFQLFLYWDSSTQGRPDGVQRGSREEKKMN